MIHSSDQLKSQVRKMARAINQAKLVGLIGLSMRFPSGVL